MAPLGVQMNPAHLPNAEAGTTVAEKPKPKRITEEHWQREVEREERRKHKAEMRERLRVEVAEIEAQLSLHEGNRLLERIGRLLDEAAMLVAGWHKHKGSWRRRRETRSEA